MGFIGFSELLLIFLLAFIVLGPEKMPEVARNLGRLVRDVKKSMSAVDSSLKEEVDEVKKSVGLEEIDNLYKDISRVKQTSQKTMQNISSDFLLKDEKKLPKDSKIFNEETQGRGIDE